jgi:hypothetical protein
VADVKLALRGGPTQFDLQTFSQTDSVVDQKLRYIGFRLPASITARDVAVKSEYALAPLKYPVRQRWPPQFGKTISVYFTLTFSDNLDSGQLLQVKCPSYSIFREPFTLTDYRTGLIVRTEVSFASGDEVHAQLQEAVLYEQSGAGQAYELNFLAIAPESRPASDVWTVQVTDGEDMPMAHTFVSLDSFPIIGNLGLKAVASKNPPAADVEVSLLIVLGDARPTLITVIAPPTFVFKSNCLVAGGAGITSCSPGQVVAERATADLSCIAAELPSRVEGLKLLVITPPRMPAARSWFVEATMVETGLLLGWGEDSMGIVISPMKDVSAVYAGIPNIMSQLALRFRTGETISRGGKLHLITPDGYTTTCGGTALKVISLPGLLECQVKEQSVFLTLNDTLTPGEYAFAVTVRTPVANPSPNDFSLLLADERGKVQDSAMDIPGQTIQKDLLVVGAPLKWTSSEAGQATTITVGFTVEEAIPTGLLGAILITFPENFGHAIEKASSVVSDLDQLPLLSGDSDSAWLDFRMVDRLIVLLDPAKGVAKGSYQLAFPVTVPEQMPAYNVWQITLCKHSSNGVCLHAQGAESLVTFPYAGFSFGEDLPGVLLAEAEARNSAHQCGQLTWMVMLVSQVVHAMGRCRSLM